MALFGFDLLWYIVLFVLALVLAVVVFIQKLGLFYRLFHEVGYFVLSTCKHRLCL